MKKSLYFLYLLVMINTMPLLCVDAEAITYDIIQKGTGSCPVNGQTVFIHYTGWVSDNGALGKKIDSSKDRNLPVRITIGNDTIEGWDEVIKKMNPGALYRFYIPPTLGYGATGVPGIVPPHSHLIFDVELLTIH